MSIYTGVTGSLQHENLFNSFKHDIEWLFLTTPFPPLVFTITKKFVIKIVMIILAFSLVYAFILLFLLCMHVLP